MLKALVIFTGAFFFCTYDSSIGASLAFY